MWTPLTIWIIPMKQGQNVVTLLNLASTSHMSAQHSTTKPNAQMLG